MSSLNFDLLETAVVVLAAPWLLFPGVRPGLTALALAALAFVWLWRWTARGEAWPVTPLSGGLLLYALTILVGVWVSAYPDLTLPKLTSLLLDLAVFRLCAFACCTWRRMAYGLGAFALVGLAILAGGLLGVQWPAKVSFLQPLVAHLPKLNVLSLEVNSNELGGTLALLLPVAAAGLVAGLAARRPGLALAGFAGFLLAGGTLFLSQSRAGWLGALAGLAGLAFLWALAHPRRLIRRAGWTALVLALLALPVTMVGLGQARLAALLAGDASGGVALGQISSAGRIEIWSRALYALGDFPLTGVGLGAFRRVVHVLYPLRLFEASRDFGHAHNIFLQTGLDLGLFGLVAYVALLLAAAAAVWPIVFPPAPPPLSASSLAPPPPLPSAPAIYVWLTRGLLAGVLALHVFGLIDALAAVGGKPYLALWTAFGLLAALSLVSTKKPEPARLRSS